MGSTMTHALSNAHKDKIIASLQRYVSAQRDRELGDIKATHLLNYILKEIGPFAYTRG